MATGQKAISRATWLCLPLSLVVCFCLATDLNPWSQTWQGSQGENADVFTVFLGDTRELFANQFYTEADIYFHSGYYPTIFDDQTAFHTPHMALFSGTEDLTKNDREAAKRKPLFVNMVNVNDPDGSPGTSRNWIDDFSRNFYPVRHTHLSDVGRPGEVAEILPWLKLSLELDPHKINAYMPGQHEAD